MNEQLREIDDQLRSASERLGRLAEQAGEEGWTRRSAPDRWSAVECITHLNLTTDATLPPLRDAIERMENRGEAARGRYRRDLLGWLIWRSQRETSRVRSRTGEAFLPRVEESPESAVARFVALQDELRELVRRADGLALGSERISSPFQPRIRYNVYSALSIVSTHQHRHLAQAERAAAAVAGAGQKPPG